MTISHNKINIYIRFTFSWYYFSNIFKHTSKHVNLELQLSWYKICHVAEFVSFTPIKGPPSKFSFSFPKEHHDTFPKGNSIYLILWYNCRWKFDMWFFLMKTLNLSRYKALVVNSNLEFFILFCPFQCICVWMSSTFNQSLVICIHYFSVFLHPFKD